MTNRLQNILIFLLMIILIVTVVIWFYVLNEGKLIVNTGVDNYTIYAGNQPTLCLNDPCEIDLKIGSYQIGFIKEGYIEASSQTTIARGKTSAVKFEAKKKMEIIPIEAPARLPDGQVGALIGAPIGAATGTPAEFPDDLNKDNIIGSAWNAKNDRFLLLDSDDSRLKIREADGEITLITTLKNISPPIDFYWSPDDKYIVANKGADIYFIEIEMGSRRKQVLNFEPAQITWSPANDFLLFNDKNRSLYKTDWEDQENMKKLDFELNLEESVWINDTTLLTYKTDTERNQTEIWTYDPVNLITENLAQKFDFPIDKITYNQDQNTAYFHHKRENGWYEMKM